MRGRDDEARSAIAPVFASDDGERWRELLRRLPPTGMVDARAVDVLLR